MRREWVAGPAAVYIVAALCAGEKAVEGIGIALAPCHLERLAEQVLCGVHEVYEDRDAGRGRRITIHVAVLPALRRAKHADPLFLLAGGPGQGARSYAPTAARFLRRVRRTRDIVLVDLRGTGASHPLECPEPADDLAALAFSAMNWRGAWRPSTDTTAQFLELSRERMRRFRRAARAGWIILAAEAAVFVPWVWLRAGTRWEAWVFLCAMLGSSAFFLVRSARWARREDGLLADLARELGGPL